MMLKDRVSIVTGSGRGIGEAVARRYGKEGSKVVVADIDAETGQRVSDEIVEADGESIFVQADITKPEDIDNVAERTLEEFGTVDILVNNAGVAVKKPIQECTLEDFDRVLSLNLRGLWYMTRAVVPTMIEKRYGKVINIASISGIVSYPDESIYTASKAGVVGMTRELACELAPYGINVNAIAPGIIETPIYALQNYDLKVKENAETLLKNIPLNRIGQPHEIAGPAAFLASDDASYMCGSIVMVDAGWIIYRHA